VTNLTEDYDIMIDQIRAIDNKSLIKNIGQLPQKYHSEINYDIKIVIELD